VLTSEELLGSPEEDVIRDNKECEPSAVTGDPTAG
jgi:hypothetical protein